MIGRRLLLSLLLLGMGWPAQSGSQTVPPATQNSPAKKRSAAHRKVAAKPTPTPTPAPTPVPTPLPPEQMPPAVPQVSYSNGQLSIQSTNSTLGSILRTVASRTGASVDLPPGAGSERVAIRLGPGSPRDVLSALLANSRFDYVLAGTPGNPGSVSKIVLTARSGGNAATPTSNASVVQPPPQPPPNQMPPDNMNDQIPDQEIPDEVPPDTDVNQADQPVEPQPGQAAPDQGQQGQGDPNQPKTPEQLLQELQRMQQQQQQQRQQQQQQ